MVYYYYEYYDILRNDGNLYIQSRDWQAYDFMFKISDAGMLEIKDETFGFKTMYNRGSCSHCSEAKWANFKPSHLRNRCQ